MATKSKLEPQNPLLLRSHRLMEAFAKSDDERDFFLDRYEGFIIYVDLDKSENELEALKKELQANKERYCLIPKLTFYETKKIMEGFVNEKVYDIDTKEKLLDIIQSKEARDNFLEFIYDHHSELEKWQLYYQERSRVRIIEWLRLNHFTFVFEEDLDLTAGTLEKVKRSLFDTKVGKDLLAARKALFAKSKTYYSSEALNPRPKRGRPPKQAVKLEVEPQITTDIYTTVPSAAAIFLFTPDLSSASSFTFSSKFGSEEAMINRKQSLGSSSDMSVESLNQKLAALRSLSAPWVDPDEKRTPLKPMVKKELPKVDFDEEEDDFDDEEEDEEEDFDEDEEMFTSRSKPVSAKKAPAVKPIPKKTPEKINGKAKLMPLVKPAAKPAAKVVPKGAAKPVIKQNAKPVVKAAAKPVKSAAKPVAKAAVKPTKKPVVAAKAKPTASAKRPMKKIIVKDKPAPKRKMQKIQPKASKTPAAKVMPKKKK